ncbi:hypothetical protein EDB85DRAFT_1890599 [Lactarius pseudohatsudake]|nr:hypothetical protein EDB85DRAFT_1890599 [Lactarius pseudohatsudake]
MNVLTRSRTILQRRWIRKAQRILKATQRKKRREQWKAVDNQRSTIAEGIDSTPMKVARKTQRVREEERGISTRRQDSTRWQAVEAGVTIKVYSVHNWQDSAGVAGIGWYNPRTQTEVFSDHQNQSSQTVTANGVRPSWDESEIREHKCWGSLVSDRPKPFKMVWVWRILAQTKWFNFRFGGPKPGSNQTKPIKKTY